MNAVTYKPKSIGGFLLFPIKIWAIKSPKTFFIAFITMLIFAVHNLNKNGIIPYDNYGRAAVKFFDIIAMEHIGKKYMEDEEKNKTNEKIEEIETVKFINTPGKVLIMAGDLNIEMNLPRQIKHTAAEIYYLAWNAIEECGVCLRDTPGRHNPEIIAIVKVVLNRLKSGKHGGSIKDVIFEKSAFSWIKIKNISRNNFYNGDQEKFEEVLVTTIATLNGDFDEIFKKENGKQMNIMDYYNPNTSFGTSQYHENLAENCVAGAFRIRLGKSPNQYTVGKQSRHIYYYRLNGAEKANCLIEKNNRQ